MSRLAKIFSRIIDKAVYCIFLFDKIKFLRYKGTRIGKNCQILTDPGNFGSEPWLIRIDNKVTITKDVILLTHDASSRLFRNELKGSNRYGNYFGTINIKNNSFIGVGSIILPGITIGPDSIVGAGSVVTKDVPPGIVVAGVPAKKICTLDQFIKKYKKRSIPLKARNRKQLRKELISKLWRD